jgi:hypothetical protein
MPLLKPALFILLGLMIVPPALNMVSFILENRSRGHLSVLKTRTRLPLPLLLLQGMASAVAGNLYWLSGVHRILDFGLSRPDSTDPAQPAIVMVHGLYHNRSAWRALRKCLKTHNIPNAYTWAYPSFGRSFEELVQDCTRGLHQVAAVHPGQGVILIGHSLGGLILRQSLCDADLKSRVLLILTLGTPHQGTRAARMGIGLLARGLVPGGSIIEMVNTMECSRGAPARSLYSNLDTMVVPASNLRIHEPGWLETETAPTTHVAMLFNRTVCAQVLDTIATALSSVRDVDPADRGA